MNESELQIMLENLNFSPIETPRHQNRLRSALVGHVENVRAFRTPMGAAFKIRLNGVFRSRRFTLIGSGAALAVVAILSLVFLNSQDSPNAQALGLINKSIKTMQSASPELRADFAKVFSRDPLDLLEEAKNAEDLEILTPAELTEALLKNHLPSEMCVGAEGEDCRPVIASTGLGYHDRKGNYILFGLDENGTLLFAGGPVSAFEIHDG